VTTELVSRKSKSCKHRKSTNTYSKVYLALVSVQSDLCRNRHLSTPSLIDDSALAMTLVLVGAPAEPRAPLETCRIQGRRCFGMPLEVTLKWNGPYENPADVAGRAGIYMVIAGQKGSDGRWDPTTYRLLDIGQSGDAADRLGSHDREACWKRNKPQNSTLLYKFAAMRSADYDESDRRVVECCLRAHHRPLPCGSECNQGYNQATSVSITNTGARAPLREGYSCRGER